MTSAEPRRFRFWSVLLLAARLAAAVTAVRRLARAAGAAPPVALVDPITSTSNGLAALSRGVSDTEGDGSIDVVVPARDEAERIGPLLAAIVGAPGVGRVIVVDDESGDGTADLVRAAGAEVVEGRALPDGWAGKAWALQQGIEASDADWVVTLDADTRPDPHLPVSVVRRAVDDGVDLLTVGGRFECPTPATRWLHASMLTTLVYRFGPPGADVAPDRTMANGQCMALRRDPFMASGGMTPVRAAVVEDVALARHVATTSGRRVAFLDGADLLRVRMFESFADTWRGWGRSLALPGVEPPTRQFVDLGVVALAQAAPLLRLLVRRGDLLDLALLATRVGTLVGTRTAYDRTDAAYWLSPLADAASTAAIGGGIVRRGRQTWRGRTYA